MRYAMGIVARSTALPRSPAIRIGRRGRRSTQTPAGSVNRMNGRNSTVPSAATWKADASSTRTAASGNASWETCVPNWLTVSADHSLRKSAWRQRPPVGHIGLAISTPGGDERGGPEERKHEPPTNNPFGGHSRTLAHPRLLYWAWRASRPECVSLGERV